MQTVRILLATALISVAGIVSLAAQQRVVHVYNWSDYIDESILADFERETGIRVVYDVYDSNEVLETKLLAGGSGYDVVVPSATFLARQIEAGVYRKLDRDRLPNLVHLWPDIAERVAKYDPDNAYSVNYMWGTTGIGYNVARIMERMADAPVGSWRMIFDPETVAKFADCGIHVLDAPAELFPAALAYLGLDPDSKDPAEIERAAGVLMAIRPHIRKFHSSEYINALANGDICLAVGYSGDILQARDRAEEAGRGIEIAYAIPREGAAMWFDQMAIPADAPHPEAAHAFVDFILRPEMAARASNYVKYANGVLASKPLLDEAVRTDTAIYPDDATMRKLFTTTPYDPRIQRTVTRLWTRVKTGR